MLKIKNNYLAISIILFCCAFIVGMIISSTNITTRIECKYSSCPKNSIPVFIKDDCYCLIKAK